LLWAWACSSRPSNELFAVPYDAGADADGAADGVPIDAGPDADPTIGGPCVDDAQCNDAIDCTFDRCDPTIQRCRNVPDDTKCDDGTYCNGRELCVLRRGCSPGPVLTCQDGTSCTTDRCNEATRACEHTPRDLDGDGDPDDRCSTKRDCNDLDPAVSSTRKEICGNGVDDNCNGALDEADCVTSANDTCASPLAIGAPGTYAVATFGAKKDYAISCGSGTFDVVLAITIPPGQNRDLDLWASLPPSVAGSVAVAVQGTCGSAPTELSCGGLAAARITRTRARNLAPGTYYAVVTTSVEAHVEVAVDMREPRPAAANETCATAVPIALDTPTTVELVDPHIDEASRCPAVSTAPRVGELTYSFVLDHAADVRVFASAVRGSGTPIVGLRTAACSGLGEELRCRTDTAIPLFARGLAAGNYVLTVAATSPIDASVVVKTSPATAAPPDETCAAPPPAAKNRTMTFDLGGHEGAIRDLCGTEGPRAAYALPLDAPSDVLLVGRFPSIEVGSVALDTAACSAETRLACTSDYTPARALRRNVPAGEYRVVVGDTLGQVGSLTTLVRPASAPIRVGAADTCAEAVDVPPGGGFFTGDTTGKAANFNAACDRGGAPEGGAPDQVLRLSLSETKRVVLDMTGSTYTTLLDIRSGASCPGQEVKDACFVGFDGGRSFLDRTLPAGTYWIVVDGYDTSAGHWNLDVHVVDP